MFIGGDLLSHFLSGDLSGDLLLLQFCLLLSHPMVEYRLSNSISKLLPSLIGLLVPQILLILQLILQILLL